MASKNFRSTLLEPTSEFAHGDKLRFTAMSTSGSVLNSSFSEIVIGDSGQYSVDLQYGKHRIDYKPYEGCWQKFADVEVNASTLSTSLQSLALSSMPVTDDTILTLQSLLADTEAARNDTLSMSNDAAMSAQDAASSANDAMIALSIDVVFIVDPDYASGDSDGSAGKPFPTISEAITSCQKGKHLSIHCVANKEHHIDSVIDGTHILSLSIQSSGAPSKASVRFLHKSVSGAMEAGSIILRERAAFRCYYINLTIDDYVDETSELKAGISAIKTSDLSLSISIKLDSCTVTYSGVPMVAGSLFRASSADILIGNSTVNMLPSIRTNSKLFDVQIGSIAATMLSLSGATYSDLVPNMLHWQSNMWS